MRVLLITLLILSLPAQARMYQWIDPETGTTQLSGKPPAWYRSTEAGPRVFVFDKGKIIDDTAINIPQEESKLLRRQAFVKAEEDKEAAKQKALEAAQLKFALDKNKQEEPSTAEVEGPTETLVEAEKEKVSDVTPNITDLSVEEMRALILDWENQRTQQARELVVPYEAEDIQQ